MSVRLASCAEHVPPIWRPTTRIQTHNRQTNHVLYSNSNLVKRNISPNNGSLKEVRLPAMKESACRPADRTTQNCRGPLPVHVSSILLRRTSSAATTACLGKRGNNSTRSRSSHIAFSYFFPGTQDSYFHCFTSADRSRIANSALGFNTWITCCQNKDRALPITLLPPANGCVACVNSFALTRPFASLLNQQLAGMRRQYPHCVVPYGGIRPVGCILMACIPLSTEAPFLGLRPRLCSVRYPRKLGERAQRE